MNTAEWRGCRTPGAMLQFIAHRVSGRKNRLLAAAMCGRVRHLVTADHCREVERHSQGACQLTIDATLACCLLQTIELAERCADEPSVLPELELGCRYAGALGDCSSDFEAMCHTSYIDSYPLAAVATIDAATAVREMSVPSPHTTYVSEYAARAVYHAGGGKEENGSDAAEEAAQCDLIRDLFPHPSDRHAIQPSWLTSTVVALARGIYADRAFDRMPILADALQDAGCDDEGVLDHCRGGESHVRGCWVVDLVLGMG